MAVIPQSDRYFAPEITEVWWVPTIADAGLVPTRIELDAGTTLASEIADWSGWNTTSNQIATPDLGSRYTGSITGRTTSDASSITFYADKTGQDVRTILARGDAGYIVIADGGDVATQPADVFPVEVASVGKVRSVGDQAVQITVNFAIKRQPAEDIALPAAA